MLRIIGATHLLKAEYLSAVKDTPGIRTCDSRLEITSDEAYVLATMTRTCKLSQAYKSGITDLIQIIAITDQDPLLYITMGHMKAMLAGDCTIIYGTLTHWITLTIELLTGAKEHIEAGNYLYFLLARAGYGECFSDYTKQPYTDKLFTLRPRIT